MVLKIYYSNITKYVSQLVIIYVAGTKAFTCDICKRKFSLKDALVSHQKTHLFSTQFACYLCNQRFREKRYLQRHLGTHSSNIHAPFDL